MQTHTSRLKVIAAFIVIYVIWGSTYLAIRYAIETLPPFLMSGIRFTIAGAILCGWMWARGAERPTRSQWGAAAIAGGLMILAGMGGVAWAEQRVTSGLTALLVATIPLWMVLLDWWQPGGVRPGGPIIAGVGVGLVGLALLIGPGDLIEGGQIDPIGAITLLFASLLYAAGSVYSPRLPRPTSTVMAAGMVMLAGGGLLLIVGSLAGEWPQFTLSNLSFRSALALGYLIVVGSLVAFTAYIWLLQVSTSARVATHAYINPVIALLLGWALAGEPLTGRTLLAAAIIVVAVIIITTYQTQSNT